MEISVIRQRLNETVERAKRRAGERRARADEAGRSYERFLEHTAVPLFRQVANVLRADGYPFNVFTPAGSVRLMSDRHAEDFIEVLLDTAGDHPYIVGHTSRSRGRRVDESERELGGPATLGEDELLAFLLRELEPFVER
jgi:hypothetical protein